MKMCIVIKKNRHQRGYPQEIQPLELSELVDSKITLNNTFRKIKEKMYKFNEKNYNKIRTSVHER